MLLPATEDDNPQARVDPRRDLKFGSTDTEADTTAAGQPAQAITINPEALKPGGAPAGLPPFRRAVSFSKEPQVLLPRGQQQGDGQQEVPFDGSNLPDGITAIPVADPNDPSVIVMQVSSLI